MDFRVLGALEVWDGDERVEVSGRLHPRILAGLLLNVGRTVSVEWLVDLLWDDAPPKTARRQVQNAVAALRRQLDPVREGLIERVGSEYRVNIEDDELDLRRFDTETREARRLAEAERWDESATRFTSALELWRGDALTGLSGRVLRAAAARLNDKYLSTFEEYARVAMAAGQAWTIVERLRELVAAHPLRQRLIARLMEALYRTGRVQDALALFEVVRDRLAEDLGIDPNPELNSLRIRVLQDDIGESEKSKLLRPAQLPTDVATFTGRTEHLAALDRLLDSGNRAGIVTAIGGIGGVGKTALAVRWGYSRRDEFPDGQLYINLRGFDEREPLTPHEAVSRLLRSLGYPASSVPSSLDEATNLYRAMLADKKMLIILDNARAAEQVNSLLPDSPGILTIVTSRNRLSRLLNFYNTMSIKLATLNPRESFALLTELLGMESLADSTATRQLTKLCGHLPLALRIVAANRILNPQKTLADLVKELGGPSRLSQLHIDNDASTNLTEVFDLSYRALDDETRHVFHHLGTIPGDDFAAELVATILESSIEAARETLMNLVDANLIEQHQPQRYRFHDLIRQYAKAKARHSLSDVVRSKVSQRLINWYYDSKEASAFEYNNIVATCKAFPTNENLWKLTNALKRFASNGYDINTIIQCTESALHAAEAHNTEGRIQILTALGGFYSMIGNNASGINACEQAAKLLPETSQRLLHGTVYGQLGFLHFTNGDHDYAEDLLISAIQIAEEIGSTHSFAIRTANLGRVYRSQGQFEKSLVHLHRAQRIAEDQKWNEFLGSVLGSISDVYLILGRYNESLRLSEQSLEIAKTINAPRPTAIARLLISIALRAQGNQSEALVQLDKALTIEREENRISPYCEIVCAIAENCIDIGDYDRAFSSITAASQPNIGEIKDIHLAEISRILCRLNTSIGNFHEGVRQGTQARKIHQEQCQSPLLNTRSLLALGDAYLGNGDPSAARSCWTEALAIATRLNVPEAGTLRTRLSTLP